jgi:hypothetical protein
MCCALTWWFRSQFVTDFSSHMGVISSMLDELYQAAARNFLFIDVPPMHRSPIGSYQEIFFLGS